ncbi:FecR family protein [Methylomonas methanica]|uniref:Anti-FecI sigma factor, FecR n=1 Tax=Methylomonas methanica (strain DSM 25384 / MC09) TaxID=857087 RepID=G0A0Y7_METMM|nr:FecR family protein [Methylomonas methanica]AEG01243.1 anti-FecI sigma factor, FecR [Methylomonas methanica MC09]
MKPDPDKQPNAAVKREATDWWVRLDSGELDPQQYQAFQRWLNADPSHTLAFNEITQLWGELDAIKPLIAPATSRQPAAKNRRVNRVALPRFAAWPVAVAVCCLMLWLSPFGLLLRADLHTGVGEIRRVQLSDGSTVTLNSDSALSVSMQADARHLTLLKGEALFQVSPDKNRPFRVYAGAGSVTALGTAFNIRLWDKRTEVTVTEHSVAINLDRGAQTTRLEEGQSLTFDARDGMGAAQIADTRALTAWQRGTLVFQDKPLGEVVAELNRYRHGYLLIGDDTIAQRRVNGVFHINDPLAALDALQTSLQIKTTRIGDYLILLHR